MFPNLKAEMARQGLTVVAMAGPLEMKERTLGNKIAGKSEFTWREIRKIHNRFFPKCSIEYLFEEAENSSA